MKTNIIVILLVYVGAILHAAPPSGEDEVVAALTGKGIEITKNAEGKATRLMVKDGKGLAAPDFALIGNLTSLEQVTKARHARCSPEPWIGYLTKW